MIRHRGNMDGNGFHGFNEILIFPSEKRLKASLNPL